MADSRLGKGIDRNRLLLYVPNEKKVVLQRLLDHIPEDEASSLSAAIFQALEEWLVWIEAEGWEGDPDDIESLRSQIGASLKMMGKELHRMQQLAVDIVTLRYPSTGRGDNEKKEKADR